MTPRLAVEKVGLAFGGVAALSGVSLTVAPGEIRGIIGPNGAGKTTLLNAICGIVPPTTGRVRLDGKDVTGLSPSAIAARGLRRTFQTSALFPGLTVLENVVTGLHTATRAGLLDCAFGSRRLREEEREAAARARRVLEFVGMAGFAERPAGALSFGQQRLVEIARALVSDPAVVLLDEPAVGLSLNRLADIDRLLRRIRDERGVTLLLIEHVIRLVMEVSDSITVLSSGTVIAEGTPDAVRQDPAVITAYLGTAVHA
ncbi:ABC transporter ATP-binding protein [Siccirubricoccus phaeus]|uniref:ABC transporter ATP-binding protein n=1 Tax=Siccirubricoccus phaeus TaxID=2595053 RepID=UPI0011F1BC3B|nr:ABC transporter ATP-binding protein [Siccirubricoccus phaeus]